MRIVDEKTVGDLIIETDTQYNDLDAGTVVVNANVTARLYGIINKDIIIKRGSKVYIHGKLRGQVVDQGGEVYIYDK